MRCVMATRTVLSTALICIAGRPVLCIAAGVHDVMDDTMSGARDGLALHRAGKILTIAWRMAGSLIVSDHPRI
jgi:hypothetical protein